MTEAELIRAVLIEGAIGGAVLVAARVSAVAVYERYCGPDVAGDGAVCCGGRLFWICVRWTSVSRIWVLIELLQVRCVWHVGSDRLAGTQRSGSHSVGRCIRIWDFGLHYLGPGRTFAPLTYAIACISFDWVVAAYILIAYRGANHQAPNRGR